MKPLSEWTESELKGEIFDGHMDAGESLEELLRRERLRGMAVVSKMLDEAGDERSANAINRIIVKIVKGEIKETLQ